MGAFYKTIAPLFSQQNLLSQNPRQFLFPKMFFFATFAYATHTRYGSVFFFLFCLFQHLNETISWGSIFPFDLKIGCTINTRERERERLGVPLSRKRNSYFQHYHFILSDCFTLYMFHILTSVRVLRTQPNPGRNMLFNTLKNGVNPL